jgi:hypothetical protein
MRHLGKSKKAESTEICWMTRLHKCPETRHLGYNTSTNATTTKQRQCPENRHIEEKIQKYYTKEGNDRISEQNNIPQMSEKATIQTHFLT